MLGFLGDLHIQCKYVNCQTIWSHRCISQPACELASVVIFYQLCHAISTSWEILYYWILFAMQNFHYFSIWAYLCWNNFTICCFSDRFLCKRNICFCKVFTVEMDHENSRIFITVNNTQYTWYEGLILLYTLLLTTSSLVLKPLVKLD